MSFRRFSFALLLSAVLLCPLVAQQTVDPSGSCTVDSAIKMIVGQTGDFRCLPSALGSSTGTWTKVTDGGIVTQKFTINYNNATLAGTAATGGYVTVMTVPAKAVILVAKAVLVTQFTSSGAMSALTVSLGDSGSATQFTSTLDCWQAGSATTHILNTAPKAATEAADAVRATFAATGANLSTLTAGQITVTITYALDGYGSTTVVASAFPPSYQLTAGAAIPKRYMPVTWA